MWRELLDDLAGNHSRPWISARFHAGIAAAFIQAAELARQATGISQVAMSGGCFHNRRLSHLLRIGLTNCGFEVFAHCEVSPGDAGLSYGQAVVGAAILAAGVAAKSGGV
jgi:hydrogenase maturation protein HypF